MTVRLPVLAAPLGQTGNVEPLEGHQRIRAAQTAGEQIARTCEGVAWGGKARWNIPSGPTGDQAQWPGRVWR